MKNKYTDKKDATIAVRRETRDRLRELSHHTYDSLITWMLDKLEAEIREGNKRFEPSQERHHLLAGLIHEN